MLHELHWPLRSANRTLIACLGAMAMLFIYLLSCNNKTFSSNGNQRGVNEIKSLMPSMAVPDVSDNATGRQIWAEKGKLRGKLTPRRHFRAHRSQLVSSPLTSPLTELKRKKVGIAGARPMNALVTDYDEDVSRRLGQLVARRCDPRDPELISLVRDLIDPPSRHIIKPVRRIVETPQTAEVMKILKEKRRGFFVEAGALDGERSSNTLFLEQRRGWTGLLVEMDPYYYTQLIGKSRRSWSINACISPHQYPMLVRIKEASGGSGKLQLDEEKPSSRDVRQEVPCFALETMLLALNQSSVDYFSLDVEGFELEVLETIPFDRIDISVLSVEYVHGRRGKKSYEVFMKTKGYTVDKDIHFHRPEIALFVDDFIFVKTPTSNRTRA